jgi:hypothetical protein
MDLRHPENNASDLVIGMTLAELFLFVLLVTWWSISVPVKAGGISPTITIANLQSENQTLKQENGQLRAQVKDLENRVEALRLMLNAQGTSIEDFKKALQQHDTTLRRGAPACAEQNTLVDVRALNSQVQVVILGGADVLSQFGKGQWVTSQTLVSKTDIDAFLAAAQAFNLTHKCRFDYKLEYTSADDYHDARTRFESYFYPEAIKRNGTNQ